MWWARYAQQRNSNNEAVCVQALHSRVVADDVGVEVTPAGTEGRQATAVE
jgi:hypothetical protein